MPEALKRSSARTRPPGAIGGAVRACQHDLVAIGIPKPDLPMIRPTIAVGRIAVSRQDAASIWLELRNAALPGRPPSPL
jgi:hypothetical protein